MNEDIQQIWEAYTSRLPIGGQSHRTEAEQLISAINNQLYNKAYRLWSSLDADGRVMVAKYIRHKHGLQYWDDAVESKLRIIAKLAKAAKAREGQSADAG